MADAPPWNTHHGGECPVPRTETVTIRFRNGDVHGPYPASRWRWRAWDRSNDYAYDITGWRRA